MTIARARLVDPEVTRWYHCVTRCVRRAMLLGDTGGVTDRKQWIENRLRELAENFAIAVGGFAMMDNHLHLLLRLDPQIAEKWTDEDVVRRWGKLFPPRDKSRKVLKMADDWVKAKLMDPNWIKKTRDRLQNLGWFMKCLKEPLARMANREDDVRGAFFEGRFKSIAILDEEALLATCAYIDLNPLAAGIAQVPESSEHTSIKQRVDHVREKRRLGDLKAGRRGSLEGSNRAKGLEDAQWLCPIENRRPLDSSREGMIEGFSLISYLKKEKKDRQCSLRTRTTTVRTSFRGIRFLKHSQIRIEKKAVGIRIGIENQGNRSRPRCINLQNGGSHEPRASCSGLQGNYRLCDRCRGFVWLPDSGACSRDPGRGSSWCVTRMGGQEIRGRAF